MTNFLLCVYCGVWCATARIVLRPIHLARNPPRATSVRPRGHVHQLRASTLNGRVHRCGTVVVGFLPFPPSKINGPFTLGLTYARKRLCVYTLGGGTSQDKADTQTYPNQASKRKEICKNNYIYENVTLATSETGSLRSRKSQRKRPPLKQCKAPAQENSLASQHHHPLDAWVAGHPPLG